MAGQQSFVQISRFYEHIFCCSRAVSFGHSEEHKQWNAPERAANQNPIHTLLNTACRRQHLLSIPAAMEPVGSPLYSQKPSNLAHPKESDQPEALSGISQTCCFSTIHSLLLQQPNHPLSADTNCFTENVFIRNLKDSPRRADAEHNQHGTTDGDT